jgi:hypothetical protein
MKKTRVLIDWLSLSFNGFISDFYNLIPKIEKYSTRQFSKVVTCFFNTEEFCVITSIPSSSILKHDMCILKVNNKFLYSSVYIDILNNLFAKNDVRNIKISRLDICIDFNHFENNLNPAKFIVKFLKEKFLKVGKAKFSVHGEIKDCLDYQYLSFGSKSSNVNYYLYNKSQEMRDVKEKIWIREIWKDSGLDLTIDVWRLEFSLKNIDSSFINELTGEFFKINYLTFHNNSLLEICYKTYFKKYMSFKISSYDSNKSRLIDLILISDFNCEYIVKDLEIRQESDKMDKYLLKRLDMMFQELRNPSLQVLKATEIIKEEFMKCKGLINYYKNKIEPFTDLIKIQPYVFGNQLFE